MFAHGRGKICCSLLMLMLKLIFRCIVWLLPNTYGIIPSNLNIIGLSTILLDNKCSNLIINSIYLPYSVILGQISFVRCYTQIFTDKITFRMKCMRLLCVKLDWANNSIQCYEKILWIYIIFLGDFTLLWSNSG